MPGNREEYIQIYIAPKIQQEPISVDGIHNGDGIKIKESQQLIMLINE